MLYCKSVEIPQTVILFMTYTFFRAQMKKAVRVRICNVKKIVLLAFVFVLLSTATGVVFIKPAVAGATIYINPDGSVTGTDKIAQDGNVYTFTGNISDSLVVQRDNIVVDGAGYTLQGTPTITGIDLTGRSNVTIQNITIASFMYGIWLYESSNTTISGNKIASSLHAGIRLDASNYSSIFGNNIGGLGDAGIVIASSSNYNSISGNNITNTNYGISLYDSSSNIVSGNNITGIALYGMWLSYSSSNTISGNNIQSGLNAGMRVGDSSYNTISENYVSSNGWGIWFGYSSYNTISGNKITSGLYAGLRFGNSNYNNISGNNVTSNLDTGIRFGDSSYNSISENNVTNNYENGIVLEYSSSNTIYENDVTNNGHGIMSGKNPGIGLSYSLNNIISGNNVAENDYGLWLHESSNNTMSGNKITENNNNGIWIQVSSNNTLRNNEANNNKYNLGIASSSLSHCIQDIDDSNTVNGEPVYYWVNKQDMTVPLDAGYVALVNCTNITVQNIELGNNWQGALLAYTTNSTITKNDVANNAWGIELDYSSNNNSISENNITSNSDGLWLYKSSNDNTVYGNKIMNNDYGIRLYESSNNSISGNSIMENNNHGVWFNYSSSNVIYGNDVTNNEQEGIWFEWSCNYNSISGNNITDNYWDSIWLYNSSNNAISGNNLSANNWAGIALEGSSNNAIFGNEIKYNYYGVWLNHSLSNTIYHNNFVDNTEQVHSLNSTNVWEGGSPTGGNYWSDYTGADSDSDGIGDSPYIIDSSNQDNHPLMAPFQEEYSLTINVIGSGSVSLNVSGPYVSGSVVELTAIPDAGWTFSGWSGDLSGSDSPETILMDGDKFVTATFHVINNPPYQPQLSITPSLAVEGNDDLTVTVTGPTPADPDGDSVTYTYRWLVDTGTGQFVDDEVAGRGDHTGNTVPAADTAVGDIWRVEVTPQDEHGIAGSTATATWQQVAPPDTTDPVADAGSDQTVVEDTTVSFDAGGSNDNVGIVSYEWDFGDGTTGTGITVTHTYTEPGTYSVTLTVTDAAGNSNTDSITITVERDTSQDDTTDTTDTGNGGANGDGDTTETVDTDGDGIENNADTDDDNDGVPDAQDAFPLDPLESLDTDGDGIGNNADPDDDNDGVLDDEDAFPLNSLESIDTDADGVGNNEDTDDDGDGMPDTWETDNGLDPLDAQDASLDSDDDGLTSFQEYEQGKNPNVYDAEAIQLRTLSVLAVVVGAFTAVTAAILANLAGLVTSFDSAISKLPIPDELKEFLQLYGEKLFETVDKAKLEALEKAPFITGGEVVALGISALIATIVFGAEEANGILNFLTFSGFADFIPSALVSVCVVVLFAELFEAFCARTCRVHKQFKLWMYGIIMFLVSGLVFLFPLGSPGITRYRSGELSKKAKGLFVMSKMLLLLTLMIPFAGLFMIGFNTIGEIGLWFTLITVFSSLIPLRPLVGKALFDYRKESSLTALAASGILLFGFTYSLQAHVTFLPHVTYLAIGAVSAVLAAITLNQMRKERST
jgi:parallel beta-helix repeat protein